MKKPIIVAELGINHDGQAAELLEMARIALECGADYVKMQTRTPRVCVPREQWDIPKVTPWGKTMPYIDYREAIEPPDEDYAALNMIAEGKWFTSVWDIPALERITGLYPDMPFIKIPSAMAHNDELIKEAMKVGPPVIASCGMSTDAEVVHLASVLSGRDDSWLLHCHSAYPAPDHELNLSMVQALEGDFMKLNVGYSSHSTGPFPALYAIAWGAKMVEVHFTLDRARPWGDHPASLEPPGLKVLVREAGRIPVVWGGAYRAELFESELPARKKLRGE